MAFRGIQKTFHYTQHNTGNIDEVFPLLCPVREKDWLQGWEYRMIHSTSGIIEENCVFVTPYDEDKETIWHVTRYDPAHYFIEFVRMTPGENVVKITIRLEEVDESLTRAKISYQYTALSKEQNLFIENELEQSFSDSMSWWEKAMNHYLRTGLMLTK